MAASESGRLQEGKIRDAAHKARITMPRFIAQSVGE
jgi:hypothetical protein